jgi:antitoxin MazE
MSAYGLRERGGTFRAVEQRLYMAFLKYIPGIYVRCVLIRRVFMFAKVQKWGNSQGLRFPKAILEEARVNVGDEVRVSVRGRKIIIEAVEKVRGKYDLKELLSRMPKNYRVEEIEWGAPVGKEDW